MNSKIKKQVYVANIHSLEEDKKADVNIIPCSYPHGGNLKPE